MQGMDKYLTTEPDNGYEKWCNEVWELVSKGNEAKGFEIPQQDVDDYWDNFFEPLTLKLSVSGTRPSGGCTPDFAALVIMRRWHTFKQNFPFLLPVLKTKP